jgi:hypothetical protein
MPKSLERTPPSAQGVFFFKKKSPVGVEEAVEWIGNGCPEVPTGEGAAAVEPQQVCGRGSGFPTSEAMVSRLSAYFCIVHILPSEDLGMQFLFCLRFKNSGNYGCCSRLCLICCDPFRSLCLAGIDLEANG